MDLFDIELRLGVSRSHSMRDKSTVLNVSTYLANIKIGSCPILPKVTIDSRSMTLKSFELSHKSGNLQSLQSSTVI